MVFFVEDDLNALMSVLPNRDKHLLKVQRWFFVEDDLNALISVLPNRDKLRLKVQRWFSLRRTTSTLSWVSSLTGTSSFSRYRDGFLCGGRPQRAHECPPWQRQAPSQGTGMVFYVEDDLNALMSVLPDRDRLLLKVQGWFFYVEDDLNALMSVLPDRDKLLLKVQGWFFMWKTTSTLSWVSSLTGTGSFSRYRDCFLCGGRPQRSHECPPWQWQAPSQGKEVAFRLEDYLNRLIINLSGRDKFLVDVFFSMTAGNS